MQNSWNSASFARYVERKELRITFNERLIKGKSSFRCSGLIIDLTTNRAIDISAKLLVGITRNHNRQKDTLVTRAGAIIDAKSLSSADLLKIVINKHIRCA